MLQRSLFRELASDYDQIVTLSEGGIEEFKKLCPSVPGNKLSCIPNMVEPPSLPGEEKKEPRCLFVGRLDNPSKGVDRLLRIWEKVEKACPDWHLDIVGDGPDAELLKDAAQKLGLSRIVFHGFQNPEPYYSRASIFCMTSTFEGFGLVLVEAMQHGCVPIAFDSYPAVRDIISHGENGILIPPFQEEDYSNAIMALTNNPDKLKRFSLHSLSISQKFSPSNLASRWNAIL
ncbi:glycosyltransferase [uncultured Akkermansia sp.]|uniref:glycosyltransferase n=1 Tax=uncultured Akkermansia sp. TaxID=512294 RepID=UPI0026285CFE|nr:glycosyltransferase [uncultured Akkermansia sp.]